MVKSKSALVFFSCLFIIIISFQNLKGDHLFLKNGNIITGEITDQNEQKYTVKIKDKGNITVERNSLLRIVYGKKIFSKRVIRLNSGEEMTAYAVAETNTFHVFRLKLYSPEEFKINKRKILFMTETNPSELMGVASISSIYCTWKSPYNPVNGYNIYIKAAGGEKFHKAGTTAKTHFTVKNLKKGVSYSIYVKAVDKASDESIASNNITLLTAVAPPTPADVSIAIFHDKKNKKKISARLSWKKDKSEKEAIKKYIIYKKVPAGFTKIGETKDTYFNVKGLSSEKTDYFAVRSVDKDDNISFLSKTAHSRELKFSIETNLSLMIPVGDFNSIFFLGTGLLADFNLENLFTRNLIFGFTTGYWFLFSNQEGINHGHIIPFLVAASYRINLNENFFIVPKISAGAALNIVSYNDYSYVPDTGEKTKAGFQPLVKFNVAGGYNLIDSIKLEMSFDYGMLISSTGLLHFLEIKFAALFKL